MGPSADRMNRTTEPIEQTTETATMTIDPERGATTSVAVAPVATTATGGDPVEDRVGAAPTATADTATATGAATPETSDGDGDPGRERSPRGVSRARLWVRRVLASIRFRILAGYVLVLAVATVASVLLVREVVLNSLDDRIDGELVQETRELNRLAGGDDPETGKPFASVDRVFDLFLERNVPARNEAFVMFIDGEVYDRSRNVLPYRLDRDPSLVAEWSGLQESDAGSVETPAGTVRYLAVPVRSGRQPLGVFVAATFLDVEARELEPAVRAAALVGILALVVGSVLAGLMLRRILSPVRTVQETARSISETDLGQRIEVRGDDEISELARTFNGLLDRLERAFLVQRAFIDDAGHELRTPITIVRGHLEVLGDDPEERRRTIEIVTDELDRMGRMVNDLLLLAKAQQPDFLTEGIVDLETLTRELFDKMPALGNRRWRLDAVAQVSIVADRQRVTQAVIQLAQNAVDHTDEGDEIGLGSMLEDRRVRLWVRDTGPGVSVEARSRIFERFARERPRRSEGSGLGLAIVRTIAERHGGSVVLSSSPGEGATFTITLPVERSATEGSVP